ncbi:Sugar kinase of the NBD/HSP70 family, may contain an N-terminal HTH domain [Pacificibacter marinus]|uniref:N-acetylglucosamine repressor n=1 Tax=Pacificibacter marinus TaxID=658057 RepID=A0A1Y5RSJ1_9RHOB|nr:Sugar kinase of the NBD/HSP70 family, may contain an N-terminal HTH domain [Pacificibacter marinus]SLN24067.1 N-acetylglucosamine repressor [Pacificibacter marinus]
MDKDGCGPTLTRHVQPNKPLKRRVFDLVRARGTIARVDVARTLDISPATVTSTSADLIARGFIEETVVQRQEANTGRGRPPTGLKVTGSAGYVIGIKISDQFNSAVILDLSGTKIDTVSLATHRAPRTARDIIQETGALIDAALHATGLEKDAITAIAVGLPGMVDFDAGRLIWCPFIKERDIALRDMLQDAFGYPVRIDNDANLLTLAELWFGAGRERDNFAVVSIEHGVGMGLVINHEMQRGGIGLGMELGHSKVQLDGALCRCGRRGCLEAYIADYALVREASTVLQTPHGSETTSDMIETLFARAQTGDAAARAIFSKAGRYLAMGLANIVTLFDPALILLSGERLRFDYLYADEVLAEMQRLTSEQGRAPTPVEIHAWGDLIWAQGAAALALEHATEILID